MTITANDLEGRCDLLRSLHRPGAPLVLPNAWDAATARAVAAAGFPAVATTSAAVAAALGYDDHEGAPAGEMLAAAARITRSVDVPVTVDAEAGYGMTAAELVAELSGIGAAGCNLEDTDHAAGDGLLDADRHATYLAGIRAAADHRGVGIVLNARIDAIIRHPQRDPAAALDEVLRRARLYFDAGADSVYPISLREPTLVAQIVKELERPVNVNPSEPLAALAEAGAARISLGGGVHNWMMGELERRARHLLAGDATAFK